MKSVIFATLRRKALEMFAFLLQRLPETVEEKVSQVHEQKTILENRFTEYEGTVLEYC